MLVLWIQTFSFCDHFASIVSGMSKLVKLMEKRGICSLLKYRSSGVFPVSILSSNVEVFLFFEILSLLCLALVLLR